MAFKETYIEVILPIPVNHGFVYKVDQETNIEDISIGKRVLVPFASRMLLGVVVKINVDKPDYQTKSIKQIVDATPCMSEPLIKLLQWASDYYFHPVGDVFKQFMPHKDIKLEANKLYRLSNKPIDLKEFSDKERGVIEYLSHKKIISEFTLTKRYPKRLINKLNKAGVIEVVFKQDKKQTTIAKPLSDIKQQLPTSANAFILTNEQEYIVNALTRDVETNTFQPILIMGVTGSGKTEIYIRLIEQAIANGKNAIILVPEIALTPQLVDRFVKRFGSIVGVIHSKVKPQALKEAYQRILDGSIKIIIGVRSAIFAPIKELGAIIVDEEHEHTYKQEDRFRYNARDVAIMRAKLEHSLVILGSATPSIESYYNAVKGKYRLYTLEHRIHDLPMPEIHVIDLKKERPHMIGNEILTKPVVNALTETFNRNKQAIIMLNKRGYASSVVCEDCGHIERCPECDIALTYHKPLQKLICHYCGYSEPILLKCPVCGSSNIKTIGIGTQRLEEELKKIFKNISMIRMDRDTTSRIGSHEYLINSFGTGDAMLLIGTQMVAKGLDFPDVELVCLPLLDIGLNLPDFRSAERTFDIIMQSAGRAGRGAAGAKVYIQTYNTDYYPLKYAVEYNTELFYNTELTHRKDLFYPPFSRIGLIIFKHKRFDVLSNAMNAIEKTVANINSKNDITILGPAPAPMGKVKGFYVYHLLVKSSKTKLLLDTLKMLMEDFQTLIPDIPFVIDMDPQHFI